MPSTAISISRYSWVEDRLDPNSTTRLARYFRASCSIIFLSVSVIINPLYHFGMFKSIRVNRSYITCAGNQQCRQPEAAIPHQVNAVVSPWLWCEHLLQYPKNVSQRGAGELTARNHAT